MYKPQADSFLFLGVLQEDLSSQPKHIGGCLEIGCGIGILSVHVAELLPECLCVATDINADACLVTQRYAQAFQLPNLEIILTDIAQGLRGHFELVIINPPYVPTQPE